MTPEEMETVRPRLEAFAAEMLGSLPRPRRQPGTGSSGRTTAHSASDMSVE